MIKTSVHRLHVFVLNIIEQHSIRKPAIFTILVSSNKEIHLFLDCIESHCAKTSEKDEASDAARIFYR